MIEKNFYGLFSSGFLEIIVFFCLISLAVALSVKYLPLKKIDHGAASSGVLYSFVCRHSVTLLLLILFLISFALKVDNLNHPGRYYFDEIFYAFTAQEMAKGNPLGWQKGERAPGKVEYEWTHPPLGKELSALGILVLGDKPSSWRIAQAIFGALGTLFIFFLAKELFDSTGAGLIASFLYTFESFIFVLSRIAMVDIFLLNFVILASLFFVKYIKKGEFSSIFLSALFCGAALSVKWTGVLICLLLMLLTVLFLMYQKFVLKDSRNLFIRNTLMVVIVFSIVPVIVYLSTYIPYFLNGNSLKDFLSFQETMYTYHVNASKLHTYRSEWWTWPLLYRPVCLYIEKIGSHREYIYAIGNPVIWWTGILIMIYSVYHSIKNRCFPLMFVVAGYLIFWLPWAVSPRKITYIYHYLPSLLFLILAMSYFLNKLWELSQKAKIMVVYFLLCVVAAFIFFHPVLSGERIPKSDLKNYRWMKSWI